MAANADKQQQHAWKMEAMQPQDEDTLACCRIWHEVLLSVIADLNNKKRQSGAYSYLCSKRFEEVALLLGINCDEARRRLVPASELAERMAKRIGPVKARTDEPDNTIPKRRTAYAKRGVVQPQPPAARSLKPGQVGMPTTFQQALAAPPGDWEDALARVFERRTLDEWEAYCLRFEIEEIIHQQQTNGVSDYVPC